MFERRTLHLARLTALCLVLFTGVLLYWQVVRGRELNPVAFTSDLNGSNVDFLPKALSQTVPKSNQDFVRDIHRAMDLEQQPAPVIQRTIDFLKGIQRGSIY